MCLKIGGCFGLHADYDDDDYIAPPPLKPQSAPPHYTGNGYPAHRTSAAGAEVGRKASYDVRRDPARGVPAGARGWHGHADTGVHHKAAYAGAYETLKQQQPDAGRGWHGYADAGVQHKPAYAGADEMSKQQPAAWNGRVAAADGARGGAHGYYHYGREQPAHKEDAADLHYPAAAAAAATADHERY